MPESDEHPLKKLMSGVVSPSQLSPGTIEGLRELAAASDDKTTRLAALHLLARLAKPSEYQVLSTLLTCLNDADGDVRQVAAQALVGFRGRAVPAMLQGLRGSEDPQFRRRLIVLLGHIGLDAGAARPYLGSLAEDPELGPLVRETLPKLEPGWRHFGPWLGAQVQDWALAGSLLFLVLLGLLEVGRAFLGVGKGLVPGGGAGPARPVSRGTILLLMALALTVLQFARALLRYDRPDKPKLAGDSFSIGTLLLALLLLAAVVTLVLWRLESLWG